MEEIKAVDVNKIIKILQEFDERDLITKLRIHFEELLDENYVPPKRVFRREIYSDSEGSAESEEEYYTIEDEQGFLSLA
jgi:hypothetical protein